MKQNKKNQLILMLSILVVSSLIIPFTLSMNSNADQKPDTHLGSANKHVRKLTGKITIWRVEDGMKYQFTREYDVRMILEEDDDMSWHYIAARDDDVKNRYLRMGPLIVKINAECDSNGDIIIKCEGLIIKGNFHRAFNIKLKKDSHLIKVINIGGESFNGGKITFDLSNSEPQESESRLIGRIFLDGKDDEIFSDEHTSEDWSVRLALNPGETIKWHYVHRWGRECRAEVHIKAECKQNGDILFDVGTFLFEGTTYESWYYELEDDIDFEYNFYNDGPHELWLELKNRETFGGDTAKFTFNLENINNHPSTKPPIRNEPPNDPQEPPIYPDPPIVPPGGHIP